MRDPINACSSFTYCVHGLRFLHSLIDLLLMTPDPGNMELKVVAKTVLPPLVTVPFATKLPRLFHCTSVCPYTALDCYRFSGGANVGSCSGSGDRSPSVAHL